MKRLDFYFDYLSGYAYIAWLKIGRLLARRQVELTIRPVLFAGLLDHWGQLGPAEIPPKRDFVYRDGLRQAAIEGFEFACPKFHPFNPLPALRLSLREVAGEHQRAVVDALMRAGWGEGIDYGSRDELKGALDRAGLDGAGLIARIDEPAVKQALKDDTARAVARGVFGVPTMMVGDELVWGSDRMQQVELLLDDKDPLDRARLEDILGRARAAERRRPS
jgi:2-hydroxychromene-2-carboxylate isomerase